MPIAKPADPNWPTFEEVESDPDLGHSAATLVRYIRDGIPLLGGKKLAKRKEYREIQRGRWEKAVLKRLVVCRDQLIAERKRVAELKEAKSETGLLEDEACAVWGISGTILRKRLKKGLVRRVEEEFVRPNKGRSKRWRYFRINGEPLKAPVLRKVPRRLKINGRLHLSTREVANTTGETVASVLAAAKRGSWHGVTFNPHVEPYGEKDESFWFDRDAVQKVRRKLARLRKLGWLGKGSLPAEAVKQFRLIGGVECESVHHFAMRNGFRPSTITATWTKRCPHLGIRKVTIKYHRGKCYLPATEVNEVEASLKIDRERGYKGVGRRSATWPAFKAIQGEGMPAVEWCVLVREAACQLGLDVKTIRQWHFRKKAPGLTEPIRFHSKARSWAYMPVEQFKAIAAARGDQTKIPLHEPILSVAIAMPVNEKLAPDPSTHKPRKRRELHAGRNAMWVRWASEAKEASKPISPAELRDRWNALPFSERNMTGAPALLTPGKPGSQTVRAVLREAGF